MSSDFLKEMIEKEGLRQLAMDVSGASAVGIVRAAEVGAEARAIRERWIGDGCHATMDYLTRYDDVRNDPRRLLDGARTMIIGLFDYSNGGMTGDRPRIAEYALGSDYHTEVRRRLTGFGTALTARSGGAFRAVVDTAPLRERYWAARAGLGVIGLNAQLIRPGHGAHYFIGTLLWTGDFLGEDDRPIADPSRPGCDRCGLCVSACPTGALDGEGRLDARRCLSYLTIESREPLPEGLSTGGRVFGCDACRLACPLENLDDRTEIEAFKARPEVVGLTAEDWRMMTPERFKALFKDSAVKRARGLLASLGAR